MAPGFKEDSGLTKIWCKPYEEIEAYINSLESHGDRAELSRLLENTGKSFESELKGASDNAFIDNRPDLPTYVGDKYAVVLSRNRLRPGTVSTKVLTYMHDVGDSGRQWPRSDQPCTIGPIVEVRPTGTAPGPATSLMRSLLDTGRVQENAEPFQLGSALSQAANTMDCVVKCTSFKTSIAHDSDTGRKGYILRAEFDVSGTTGYIDGDLQFESGVLRPENWQSGCPATISRFVNDNLQAAMEKGLERCLPWRSLDIAQRASRIASSVAGMVKRRSEWRVTRYGDLSSGASRDKPPKKNDPFVATVHTLPGHLVLVIRDWTLGSADTLVTES